jgi:cytochrome c oxidase subunit 2
MKALHRREWLAAASALLAAGWLGRALAQPSPRVIEMVARRFRYEPSEVKLKAGESVVISITALDFTHGFSIPDLKRRYDLVVGRATRIELQPMTPGVIDFHCDNFCGDGHESMSGRFIVTA